MKEHKLIKTLEKKCHKVNFPGPDYFFLNTPDCDFYF